MIPFIINGERFISSLIVRIGIVLFGIWMSFSVVVNLCILGYTLHSRIINSQGFLVSGCEMFSVCAVVNVVLDTT